MASQSNILLNANAFSAVKHIDQRRKNSKNDPYINHPIEVAKIISNAGIDDTNTLAAALLHDTVEDTKTTYEELVSNFGKEIADIVMECTDDKKLTKVERKKLQITHAQSISKEAKIVKLADKISNLKSLQTDPPTKWSPEVIKGYIFWSYAVCLNLFTINEKLDTMAHKIFSDFGVFETVNDQHKLHAELDKYYQLLN